MLCARQPYSVLVSRTWELQLWLVLLDVGQELQHPVAHLNADHLQQALGRSAQSRRAGCRVGAGRCVAVANWAKPSTLASCKAYTACMGMPAAKTPPLAAQAVAL